MNNENNNNNDLNLSNLYGVTTSENVKQSSEELQKEIEQNIETPPPVKEEPKKEPSPPPEKPNKNNNSTSAVPLLIILIIVIVVGYNFIIKNDDTSLKTEKNEDNDAGNRTRHGKQLLQYLFHHGRQRQSHAG